jgi:hypothetical protein
MGCQNSKQPNPAATPFAPSQELQQISVRDLERATATQDEQTPLKSEPAEEYKEPILHEVTNKVKAKSGRKQTIIDRIYAGEDFHENRWRCIFDPERAYYTLSPSAKLEIKIIKARRLIPALTSSFEKYTGDEPDAFVRVYTDDVLRYETQCINNTRSPEWNHDGKLDIVADRSMVRLSVYDSDSADNSTLIDHLGFVELCVGDMPFNQAIEGWFELNFPQNLQGANVDRYDQHCEKRVEDTKLPMPQQPNKGEISVEGVENLSDEQLTMVQKAKVSTSWARNWVRRAHRGVHNMVSHVSGNNIKMIELEDNKSVQYNAGEIYISMRLVPVVDEHDLLFAKVLTPSYLTFASFIQEEYLPKLELQELVDDLMDVKLKVVDDMVFSLANALNYILRWRSKLISGFLFTVFLSCGFSISLSTALLYFWLATVLLLQSQKTWRDEMTTGGWNAPLTQSGYEMVAATNDISEMNEFLARVVESRLGEVKSEQDLLHFAGTLVLEGKDGKPDISFQQLIEVMCNLPFLDLPSTMNIKKGTLIRVDELNRGEVVDITHHGTQVVVDYDENDLVSGDLANLEVQVDMERCKPRLIVPRIPRALIPKPVVNSAKLAMLLVARLKLALIPNATMVQDVLTWKSWQFTLPIFLFLVFRGLLSAAAFSKHSAVAALIVTILSDMKEAFIGLLVLAILFSKTKIARLGGGLIQMSKGYFRQRNAPDMWKFYKKPQESYSRPM